MTYVSNRISSGADDAPIDLSGEITDWFGTTVQRLKDHIDVAFAGPSELATRPVEYQTCFTLFTVSNLNEEAQGVPISPVAPGSQRAATATALGANPLYQAFRWRN